MRDGLKVLLMITLWCAFSAILSVQHAEKKLAAGHVFGGPLSYVELVDVTVNIND